MLIGKKNLGCAGRRTYPATDIGQTNMQNLLQTRVLKLAGLAALATAVACHPRFVTHQRPPAPAYAVE